MVSTLVSAHILQNKTLGFRMYNALDKVSQSSRSFLAVILCTMCIMGILASVLSIYLLMQRRTLSSSGVFLMGLTLSDGLTMLFSLPFSVHLYEASFRPVVKHPISDSIILVYIYLLLNTRGIANWLAVALPFFMYKEMIGSSCLSNPRAFLWVLSVFITVTLLSVPSYIGAHVSQPVNSPRGLNMTIWTVQLYHEAMGVSIFGCLGFWNRVVLVNLLPCAILPAVILLIVKEMRHAAGFRRNLETYVSTTKRMKDPSQNIIQISRMLLVSLLVFLAAELPLGISLMLGGIYKGVKYSIPDDMGDMLIIWALMGQLTLQGINSLMNKRFRDALRKHFRWKRARLPAKAAEPRAPQGHRPKQAEQQKRAGAPKRGGEQLRFFEIPDVEYEPTKMPDRELSDRHNNLPQLGGRSKSSRWPSHDGGVSKQHAV